MQPLKLIIPGRFWDSQIYAGRLYLFGQDGDITTLDWDRLIEEWNLDNKLRLALDCAFLRSAYLYNPTINRLFKDSEVRSVLEKKFDQLAAISLEASYQVLQSYGLGQQDNPLPFPHTDSEIYYRHIFVSSQSGIHRTSCDKKRKKPVGTRISQEWERPVCAISASYRTLAFAAGDEGLYELPLEETSWNLIGGPFEERSSRVSQEHCVDCNWTFHSLFASSHVGKSVFVRFTKTRESAYDTDGYERRLEEVIPSSKIFGQHGYAWGAQDKLCLADRGRVHVVRYSPWNRDPEKEKQQEAICGEPWRQELEDLGEIVLDAWKGDVVSGGTAVFGVIIECDNAIVILQSDGMVMTLPGEPVNWRIFPRSIDYENQLHVIYPDRLEIFSFNHDYFVDQKSKRSGIRFFYHPERSRNFPERKSGNRQE